MATPVLTTSDDGSLNSLKICPPMSPLQAQTPHQLRSVVEGNSSKAQPGHLNQLRRDSSQPLFTEEFDEDAFEFDLQPNYPKGEYPYEDNLSRAENRSAEPNEEDSIFSRK